jgi:hypothetical protein
MAGIDITNTNKYPTDNETYLDDCDGRFHITIIIHWQQVENYKQEPKCKCYRHWAIEIVPPTDDGVN